MKTTYVNEQKTTNVTIKVTPTEKAQIKELANEADLTVSKYLWNYLPINKNTVEVDDWSYHELYERAYNGDKSVAQIINELLKNSL